MMRILSACAALAIGVMSVAPADAAFLPERIKVVEVIDGDDFYFTVPENGAASAGITYRGKLMGVDAPDKQQCFADRSRLLLKELIGGKSIQVKYDSGDKFSDHGGFHLMYLYWGVNDELDVNAAMIETGHGVVASPEFDRKREFVGLEERAEKNGRGGWASISDGGCIPD